MLLIFIDGQMISIQAVFSLAVMLMIMLNGSNTCHLFYLHIALLCMLLYTGVTPFEMMFGHTPQQPLFLKPLLMMLHISCQNFLRSKLTQLIDFVETQLIMTEAANKQKVCYDQHASPPSFKTGDAVWLTSPTANILARS